MVTSREYRRRARQRVLQTGESYAEALLQVRSDAIVAAAAGCEEIDPVELSRATAISKRGVVEILTYLARQGNPACRPCAACRDFGADAECEQCSEESHAGCLEEVVGRQVCGDCAAIMEGARL